MKHFLLASLTIAVLACAPPASTQQNKRVLNPNFSSYWYAGEAEITAFTLEQSRYGAPREGDAVLIYVTEDFYPDTQVKAERRTKETISVLKLNATKRFNTGIYPYTILQSTFSPVHTQSHALKTSASIQEWCGHVYAQINNRAHYEYTSHSYFEGEADQNLRLPKVHMENDFWNLARLNPQELPTGEFQAIPSLEAIRLLHLDKHVYEANANLEEKDGLYHYTLEYPEINRSLTIRFEQAFPHAIQGWEENLIRQNRVLTTKAHSPRQIRLDYWNKNRNTDLHYRDSLKLR